MDRLPGDVRVRFAPSPTGYLHIGSVRTALFNYAFARAMNGRFLLRIEDTDRSRYVDDSVTDIIAGLRWLGLDWDEGPEVGGEAGPYFQSERTAVYREAVMKLVESGDAYYCFCSSERLEEMRERQKKEKHPSGYDGVCRGLSPEQVQRNLDSGTKAVVRFRAPKEGKTVVDDTLRGEISFENRLLDDTVLLKSDGFPTYHLANVVDDHLMQITHVIRGDEWISSAPRHILLYRALGYQPPAMIHLPVILAKSGGKLSKRHGATTLREFRDKGYLPEAMVNFLALLGWTNESGEEVFSPEDLVGSFTLDRVGTSPAVFSYEKLDWLNGVHIRGLDSSDLALRCMPYLVKFGVSDGSGDDTQYMEEIAPLIRERLEFLSDAPDLVSYFFSDEVTIDDPDLLVPKKMDREGTAQILEGALSRLESVSSFGVDDLEACLREYASGLDLKMGQVFMPIRVAVSGRTATPGLFETLSVLGREKTLRRVKGAIAVLRTSA